MHRDTTVSHPVKIRIQAMKMAYSHTFICRRSCFNRRPNYGVRHCFYFRHAPSEYAGCGTHRRSTCVRRHFVDRHGIYTCKHTSQTRTLHAEGQAHYCLLQDSAHPRCHRLPRNTQCSLGSRWPDRGWLAWHFPLWIASRRASTSPLW